MTRRLSQAASAFLRLVAVAGPALLAVLAALYTGGPSPGFLALGLTLGVVTLECVGWICGGPRWFREGVPQTTKFPFFFFLGGSAPPPSPPPPPLSDPLPQASSPASMAIYSLPTGVIHR